MRRRQLLLATAAAAIAPALHAKTPLPSADNPLLLALKGGVGDDTQVARLWLLIAEQAQRAAVLARCSIGQQPLTALEWEPAFQAALIQDCRQIPEMPIFLRIFVQTWIKATNDTWRTLNAKEQAQWRQWLAAPSAQPALNSMRAETVLALWEKDWNIDARTGAPTAVPVILAAQALRQSNVLPVAIQAMARVRPGLAQAFAKIKPLAQMTVQDKDGLLQLSSKLATHSEAIYKNYLELADKQWPARVSWGDGPLANHPLQCDYVMTAEVARIAGPDALKIRPADYAPNTLAKFCS